MGLSDKTFEINYGHVPRPHSSLGPKPQNSRRRELWFVTIHSLRPRRVKDPSQYIEKLTPMHSCLALSNGTVFFHNLFPARGRTHQPPTRPDRAWPERIKVLQMGFQMSWDPIRRTFIGQALSGRVDGWHDLHLSQRLCFGPRLEVARFLRNPVGNSSVSVRFVSTKRANGSFLFDYMGQWELLI